MEETGFSDLVFLHYSLNGRTLRCRGGRPEMEDVAWMVEAGDEGRKGLFFFGIEYRHSQGLHSQKQSKIEIN